MNRLVFLAIATIAVVVIPLAALADVSDDFNTAGALDADFNHTATPAVTETDGVGVGGSRGLSVTGTGDTGYTYKLASLDFSQVGTTLGVSMFFKTAATLGTTGEQRIFELNLVQDPTNIVTGVGAP